MAEFAGENFRGSGPFVGDDRGPEIWPSFSRSRHPTNKIPLRAHGLQNFIYEDQSRSILAPSAFFIAPGDPVARAS